MIRAVVKFFRCSVSEAWALLEPGESDLGEALQVAHERFKAMRNPGPSQSVVEI